MLLSLSLGGALAQFPKGGIPGPCTEEQANGYAGVWVKTPDAFSELAQSGLTAVQRSALVAKTDKVLAILRNAYPSPRGVDVWNYRWAYRAHSRELPYPLSTNLIFMQYRCYSKYRDTGQPRLVVEQNSDAWVMVEFNSLGQALRGELPDGYELLDGEFVYSSPIELGPDFRPGFPTLKGTIEPTATVVFIGRENRLPIRAVTREEILRIHSRYSQAKKKEEIEKYEKQAARYRAMIAGLKQRADESAEEFAKRGADLRTDVEREEQRAAKAQEEMAGIPLRVQRQIESMTPEERRKQAVVGGGFYADLSFDRGAGLRPLWAIDRDYFGKGLPRSAVQYMTVFWRRVPSSPSKEAAFDELLAKLDFEALRALLDR